MVLFAVFLITTAGCVSSKTSATAWQKKEIPNDGVQFAKALALYGEAIRLETEENYPENAIPLYHEAIELEPEHERSYEKLASCYVYSNALDDGIDDFRDLVQTYTNSYAANRWLALLYQLNTNSVDAEKYYLQSVFIKPSASPPYVELATIYYLDNRISEAAELLAKALTNVDDLDNILNVTGKMYINCIISHRNEKALVKQYRVLMRDIESRIGGDLDALLKIAGFYNKAASFSDLETLYHSIITNYPSESRAYEGLAGIYIRQGREQAAINLLKKAETLAGKPYEIMALRAYIHEKLAGDALTAVSATNQREEAISALEGIPFVKNGNLRQELSLLHLYAMNQHFEKALKAAKKLNRIYPDNPRINTVAIQAILVVGSDKKEDTALRIAALTDSYKDDPSMLLLIADILLGLGQPDHALPIYNSLANSEETHSIQPYLKISLITRGNDPDAAMSALDKGLRVFPDSAEILTAKAQICLNSGDNESANGYFARAHKIIVENNNTPASNFILQYVISLQAVGRISEAIELMEEPGVLTPSFLHAYFTLSFMLNVDETNDEKVFTVLNTLRDKNPGNASIEAHIGLYYDRLSDYTNSATAFSYAIDITENGKGDKDPWLASYCFWYATSLEHLGKTEEAETLFERCIELDPDFVEAYNYLAYIWSVKGVNLKKARQYINIALSIEPENGAFMDTLGWIDYMEGQYSRALNNLDAANKLIPEDPTIIEHLGDVHNRLNTKTRAIEFWEKSYKINPENPDLIEKLRNAGSDAVKPNSAVESRLNDL